MNSLHDRLSLIVRILEEDNHILDRDEIALDTGFVACLPELLAQAVEELVVISPPGTQAGGTLDLGCGNGGFAIMAAVAGYTVHGIDVNVILIEHARENLAKAQELGLIQGECTFVVGDMIPKKYHERYEQFRIAHKENPSSMPLGIAGAYDQIPVTIASADIIYVWAWPTQSRFVYNMLQDEAKQDCIFILPNYTRYTQGEHINASLKESNRLTLSILSVAKEVVIIGRRTDEDKSE